MALKGTLKDFGIADILQLIGQQQKTGVLHLAAKEEEVTVAFKDGSIVRAESSTRKRKDLIGTMLVRAEIITEARLEEALEIQRRTLKRLGDVLVSAKMISPERFKLMVQLQATETLYRLFGWKNGTYQFDQEPVEPDAEGIVPLRAESVLMEGFRMVDEWPEIRKVISRPDLTFEKLKPLPPPAAPAEDPGVDDAFDDAFAEKKKEENKGEFKSLGDNERKLYELVAPGRDLRKLIDLSWLGEFETSKALANLCNLEYLKAIHPEGKTVREDREPLLARIAGGLGRVAVTVAVLAALVLIASRIDLETVGLGRSPSASYADPAAQRFIARAQVARIQAAIDVYRLEKGALPERLDSLVEAGLLGGEDLRYPWREAYYYRRTPEGGFVLLPPLR